MRTKLLSPYWLPVWLFAGGILCGTAGLMLGISHPGGPLSFVDAAFTATSAMCVTGLAVVDTGTFFSTAGQSVILILAQLGGLGIMTFTTLFVYLLGKRVSLSDRIAVGQSLLRDSSFSLSGFLVRVVVGTFVLEAAGALCLWLLDPVGFSPFSAVFHSISAFCNAGFSLFPDSLSHWAGNWAVNTVFMVLITLGGLGFYVINECVLLFKFVALNRRLPTRGTPILSWHTSIVLKTSAFLVIIGAVVIFTGEVLVDKGHTPMGELVLTSLFQSVSCRTAGFNTVDIGSMTNVSLAFMMGLMFIGGSPGSCAGGIKTTAFRAICAFVKAQFRGDRQVRIGRFALSRDAQNRVVSLFTVGIILIGFGTMALTSLESANETYLIGREKFMDNMFEVVSAFGTVGLSTGLTPELNSVEKGILIILMFVGRLGPIWLLSALHSWQTEKRYKVPEKDLPFG